MRVRLSTILPVPAERAWEEVLQPGLLDHVAWPLQTFERLNPPIWPEQWSPGDYEVRLRLFGVLPMGRQRVGIRDMEDGPDRYGLRDDGSGDLARRWDHLITIEPVSGSSCRYTDDVKVAAGLLTPLVWAFAHVFYRHRQRRWRALVAADFAPMRGSTRMTVPTSTALLQRELATFRTARDRKDANVAWTALERAHIISQPRLGPHLRVHWLMFGYAVRLRQPREVAGQAIRLALAPLGAITGRIPRGNTGRAGVSAFEPMPLPADLAEALRYETRP